MMITLTIRNGDRVIEFEAHEESMLDMKSMFVLDVKDELKGIVLKENGIPQDEWGDWELEL